MFLRTLIDDYIVPLVGQSQPVFTGLIRALLTIGGVYLVGSLAHVGSITGPPWSHCTGNTEDHPGSDVLRRCSIFHPGILTAIPTAIP